MPDIFFRVWAVCRWCDKRKLVSKSQYRAQEKKAVKKYGEYFFFCSKNCAHEYYWRVRKRVSNHHGTVARYSKGCRCAMCKTAQTFYMREYYKTHPRKRKSTRKAKNMTIEVEVTKRE